MSRAPLLIALTLASVQCSSPAAPPPAAPAKPLVSGLDVASFDRSVRPQDDLFRHVNGGWLASTEIPPDKPAYGGFYEAYRPHPGAAARCWSRRPPQRSNPPGSDGQKIGDFFTAFMDEARVEQLGDGAARSGAGAPSTPWPPRPTWPATSRGR